VGYGYALRSDVRRIQVKSARLYSRRNETPYYIFHLNNHLAHGNRAMRRKVKHSDCVDIFVLWGIHQDRFWIIPAEKLDYMDALVLGNEPRWIDPAQARAIRAAGKSYEAIGKELSIGTMTAWKKVNLQQNGRESVTAELKQFENRWDLITKFAAPIVLHEQLPLWPQTSDLVSFA
jgi:hypothetical protein